MDLPKVSQVSDQENLSNSAGDDGKYPMALLYELEWFPFIHTSSTCLNCIINAIHMFGLFFFFCLFQEGSWVWGHVHADPLNWSLSGIYLNEKNSDGPCSKQNNHLFGETFCSPVNWISSFSFSTYAWVNMHMIFTKITSILPISRGTIS